MLSLGFRLSMSRRGKKLPDMCSDNVEKGKRIIVMGTLRQDRWEGKDGKTQSKIKLVGSQIRLLDCTKREHAPAAE